jgi:hypothetical protein
MNEFDFITNIPILYNYNNRDTIYNNYFGDVDITKEGNVAAKGPLESSKQKDADGKFTGKSKVVVFKGKEWKTMQNYYKDTIYRRNEDINPYLRLIKDFEDPTYSKMRFKAADFSYLTDLGVYPLNRMWVLRRFNNPPNHRLLPDNISDKGTTPISTMIGWIEPGDDKDSDLLSLQFNETWTTQNKRMDQVIVEIMNAEFGLNVEQLIPVPGFTQGLLFNFLNRMGISNYDGTTIPQGDPDVLQEAASRAIDAKPSFSNKSKWTFTLKTSYEQKYIGDIDPGSAMLDIIQNCLTMGTRDTKYIFSGGSLASLEAAISGEGNSPEAWINFIVDVFTAFIEAINSILVEVVAFATTFKESFGSKEETTDAEGNKTEEQKTKIGTGITEKITSFGADVNNNSLLRGLLASTVGKWRYALQGSIAVMTGQNTTPWHLTIGNPYSPYISMGNIIVESVTLKPNNEFAFNDIPTKLNVDIAVSQGRNMGKQELMQVFNNGYDRVYYSSTPTTPGTTQVTGATAQQQATPTTATPTNKPDDIPTTKQVPDYAFNQMMVTTERWVELYELKMNGDTSSYLYKGESAKTTSTIDSDMTALENSLKTQFGITEIKQVTVNVAGFNGSLKKTT